MNNYNRYSYQMKEIFASFSNKISKNIGKVENKFITCFIYGIIKSQSVLLSNIARALKENIKLKETINRISDNLEHLHKHLPNIWNNYYDLIKTKITKGTIISFDFSDVIKPLGKKFEDLSLVPDGSDEHKTKLGYWVAEATALINERPVSLYSYVFSTITKSFKSTNDVVFKIFNKIYKAFGNIATITMDRGFDDQKFFKYFVEKTWDFIIRVSHVNRIVIHDGIKIKLNKLEEQFKGKYNIKLNLKGIFFNAKCSYAKILVPGIDKELTVVFVYFNKSTSMFITNKEVLGKHTCLSVVASYYKRWRIEEYFKYKKQQFNFENFRVRSLNKINSLNTLLSMALSSIEIIARKNSKLLTAIKYEAKSIKDKVYFDYYRVASGIKEILGHCVSGIQVFLTSSNCSQLALFDSFQNFAET